MAPIPETQSESETYVKPASEDSKNIESYTAVLVAVGLFGVVAACLALFAAYNYIKIGVKKYTRRKREERMKMEEIQTQRDEGEGDRERTEVALQSGPSGAE